MLNCSGRHFAMAVMAVIASLFIPGARAGQAPVVDYLGFAQGAVPVAMGGATESLRVGMEQALAAIDGNEAGYSVTPRPGGADTQVWFLYRLPAFTTFTSFAVPNVLETPSPSQTFFRDLEIAGSAQGPEGPFETLGEIMLTTHGSRGEITRIPAKPQAVGWVRLTLQGGIRVERDQTFFEFSEIIGEGSQEAVPRLDFAGKWRGRGVQLELRQDGATVSGCFDREGDLTGMVTGNLLRATGKHRTSGVSSSFVLTVLNGGITGVRSTNGAPFTLYAGEADPALVSGCGERPVRLPACGDNVHGINFDLDSADIRPDSEPVLDALNKGLNGATAPTIILVGHTSSEGSESYNADLSQRRAVAVVRALVDRGIDNGRLAAEGAGESRPIAENVTEAGRSLNRRVEILCR